MRSSTTITVRLPHALARHVVERAEVRGITVNAWLLRLVTAHAAGRLIEVKEIELPPEPEPAKLRA